jgi:hypothetical protein
MEQNHEQIQNQCRHLIISPSNMPRPQSHCIVCDSVHTARLHGLQRKLDLERRADLCKQVAKRGLRIL